MAAANDGQGLTLRYRVDGMDCPSCVGKLQTALGRIEGVSGVEVNFATGLLAFGAAGAAANGRAVEDKIRALGFTPTAIDDTAPRAPALEDAKPWSRERKAQLVGFTGLLLAAAFVASLIVPAEAEWAYLAAALIGLVPVARRALTLIRSGSPFSIETLMAVAAIGAIAIGAASEAAVVVFLFAVGELLETVAAGRARQGIKALVSLVPRTAQREVNGVLSTVAVDDLAIGDIVLVRPGDRVPADGEIVDGASELDEAPITGESVPVAKAAGDAVYAGSINAGGVLRLKVTRAAADNTIARIIHMVETAQSSKAPSARFIDRFSAWYTPAAMAVAALVIAVPPLLFGGDWTVWTYRGLSLLLIACPCALVLSTPAAIASGIAAGTRRGLLLKGGAALEMLGKVKAVAFDKTGTLTIGRPQVTDIVPLVGTEAAVLAEAAAVESGSSHPLARAILDAASARRIAVPVVAEASAIAGKAVLGRVGGALLAVGSPRYAAERGPLPAGLADRVAALEAEGKTVVLLLGEAGPRGLIALRDEPREDAAAAVAALRRAGVQPVMLTGDNRRTAAAVAGTLGIAVEAELLPDDKLAAIGRLKAQGPVAMVGDGINDAPALAAASVGIAMGGGTDVALETADAALLNNRVTGVAELIGLSRATLANIHQNIAVALGLKGLFLATTLLGATSLWMAILADTGATVLVTLNALRLLRLLPTVRPAAAPAAQAHDHDHGHDHDHAHDHGAGSREADDCCAHGACGSPPASVACGSCRAPNQGSARFCSQCGQAMAA
ncbi:cadmium-translocating P-type ATPase [Mycobacterium sp. KBS0706]|uniref:heavy metal translocating P-type ATPase n=1 Tax=Mycobacterium sp. KBS0706 TaxID=2578109 RepID=UPI00110F9FD6|nr:heavy metal translocating P-type ATPase [Mycobacterium sp. KBS0706]TSD87070.1 cadmium-translocating P-type ATPase [Mycobacterium sp. KBS0706]